MRYDVNRSPYSKWMWQEIQNDGHHINPQNKYNKDILHIHLHNIAPRYYAFHAFVYNNFSKARV